MRNVDYIHFLGDVLFFMEKVNIPLLKVIMYIFMSVNVYALNFTLRKLCEMLLLLAFGFLLNLWLFSCILLVEMIIAGRTHVLHILAY